MKRTLIIALCCLTALLAACNKEKPNEKFLGDWYGNGVANVNLTMTVPTGGSYSQEFNNITVPMSINLAAGETKDQVIFTYTNEEVHETYTTKGIVKNNDVDFDPISVNMTVEGTTVTATLDLKGILSTSGDVLALNGTVSGQGNYAEGGLFIPYTATGTITANLNRGAAPTPAPYNGPTITLFEDENCISEGSEVVAGELFFVALSGEGKALKDLKVVFVDNDANILEEWTKELKNGNEFTSTKYFTLTQVGDVTMTATVTDSQDKMASLDVHFKILPAPEPEFEAHYAGSVNLDATASALMRSTISPADFLVKERILIVVGSTPCSISQSALAMITRVLPVPAPASTRRCLPVKVAARFWASFRLLKSISESDVVVPVKTGFYVFSL